MTMLQAVNILAGQSRYDVFNHWQKSLCAAFRELGVAARIIPGAEEAALPPERGTISMGFNLVRQWGAVARQKPHFSWMVDHPAFHGVFFEPHLVRPPLPVNHARCLVGNVDARWTEFAKKFYDFQNIHFLPHVGTAPCVAPADWRSREYEIVFFGTLESPERRRALIIREAGPLAPLLDELMRQYTLDSGKSLDEVFYGVLKNCLADDKARHAAFNHFLPLLTGYFLHAGQRVQLLRSIKRHRVHVFGEGPWAELALPDNVVVHAAVDFEKALAILRRSRILLNHSPLMFWGGHERVCDALLSGCLVLSSFSHFLRAEFGLSGAVAFYQPQPGAIDAELDEHLVRLLDDTEAPERIAAAQKVVLEKHTMAQRAAAIRQLSEKQWPEWFV